MSIRQNEPPVETRSRSAGCLLPLLIGLIVGLAAAGAAAAVAWRRIPVQYRATAWLRITPSKPSVEFKVGGDEDVLSQPQAHATLLTSRFVLEAALRKSDVSQLECLHNEEDRLAWLRERVDLSFPGSPEILQVAMTGEDPSELATLVNAVTDAYMEEVVGVDRENHLRKKRLLEQVYKRNLNQIQKKTEVYQELAEESGVGDPELARVRLTSELERLAQLRLRQGSTEAKFCGAEERVRILKERYAAHGVKPAPPDTKAGAEETPAAETDAHDDGTVLQAALLERSVLAATLGELTRSVRKAEAEVKEAAASVAEFAQRREELERLKNITERMRTELEQWERELASPGPVSVLARATPPKTGDLRAKIYMVVFMAFAAFAVASMLATGAVVIVRSLTARGTRA